ncbi:helix-turn-helix transcriptional regulator [Phycicoccus flavus]|uniref:AAA family ATPase n=1 Tax=Phycicoccus flavus TaxID=2502783 RepID=A0A8T6R893_9MICO|nr:AAA family ATPase [Phycicoccus flavus]NHA69630.1 AAA family ATPase [Phycicoccus flavus]
MAAGRLWERGVHLRAAERCLRDARAGRSRALFFVGGAGLGKTALLEGLVRQHAQECWRVVRCRCDVMESSLAFGLVAQVVHALGGWPQEVAAGGGPDEEGAATWFRMLRWVETTARASRDPLLLAIDDLQSADPDSLAFLGFLCRRLTGLPIAVVATSRGWPPPAADLVRALVARDDGVVVDLLPLSRASCAELLAERSGRPVSPRTVDRAWRHSGGNPLLLDLLAVPGAGDPSDPSRPEGVAVPVGGRSLVLSRFSVLSTVGTTWARAAAVLGVGFRPDVVAEVAGLDAAAADRAAEEVWRSGLARDAGQGVNAFVHPLFAQLLYEDLPPSARTRLHGRAFAALVSRGFVDLAAEHAVRGHLAGDARAVEVLTVAGRRALAAGAPATAANRFEQAAHLAGDAGEPELLGDLGRALLRSGRVQEAAAVIARLLETEPPARDRVRALTLLSQARFASGDFDGAGLALRSAAALTGHDAEDDGVLPYVQHALAVLMTRGPAAALAVAEEALDLASRADPGPAARARASWGLLASFCGDPTGLEAARAEAGPLLAAGSTDWAADLRTGSSFIAPFAGASSLAGDFAAAEAAFRTGIEAADSVGAVHDVVGLRIGYGLMLLRTRVEESLAVADGLLSVVDLVPLAEPFARTIRSHALLQDGQQRASAEESQRALAVAVPFGLWQCRLLLHHVEGIGLLRAGRVGEASTTYRELEQRERDLGLAEPCTIHYARHALLAHLLADRPDDAERVLAGLDAAAARLSCPWIVAAASAGRAALARRAGDTARAERHYLLAADTLESGLLPVDRAEVLLEHGTMLRQDGRPREARVLLRSAAEAAGSVGARWLATRAGEELATAGGRRVVRRAPQDLTPQERRVARLAATGASDKDIAASLTVSVRTVRTHLEHIYLKRGIHSRRELMARGEDLED